MEVTVAHKRGFFAEMQHQQQVAARQAEQRQRAAAAAAKRVLAAQRSEQLLIASTVRASEADRKRMEREGAAAHVLAKQAEVDELNGQLAATYTELDNILAATIDVDDYVDLTTLRRTVEHPPFPRPELEVPIAPPAPIADPAEPILRAPEPPKGLFGKKKKLEEATARAASEHANAHAQWQQELESVPAKRANAAAEHAAAEAAREAALADARGLYATESAAREAEVAEHNAAVDKFVADLGYGAADAVKDYVSLVLGNSSYPEEFEVEHEEEFEPSTAELKVRVLVPSPDKIPTVKAYKYTKATDEITEVAQTQKDTKARYANVVNQVALRILHEVFEADRRKLVQSVSLEVGTTTTSPATGKPVYYPFVAVATHRDSFEGIDLSGVIPAATLEHLGAAISKSPYDLTPAVSTGVRRA
jgi:restriction system protein